MPKTIKGAARAEAKKTRVVKSLQREADRLGKFIAEHGDMPIGCPADDGSISADVKTLQQEIERLQQIVSQYEQSANIASKMPEASSADQQIEGVRQLFGEHPEDVISPIRSAADALFWLQELFHTIEREALNERNGYRIKHLAEMGAYLALDMGNFAGCRHEDMIQRLIDAGIIDRSSDRSEVTK